VHDEDDFLRKLLENPADDIVRLVYADWLDERGDDESKAKAQFLRLTARLLEPERPKNRHKTLREKMQRLAAKLSTDWLAVVSRLQVERCAGKDKNAEPTSGTRLRMSQFFTFVCDKRWDEMAVTDDVAIRHCDQCGENVHYCDTILTAREHAEQGHCIAVDLGIIRRDDDLSPRRYWAGKPRVETLQKEKERWRLDAVSLEREERKRQQNADESSN
jgi:uncharacterized protein (TIGR02996 family)